MALPLPLLLSAATALVSLAFAALVLAWWARARRAHQLLWGSALLLFAAASALEVQGALAGWGEDAYRAYFVVTAVMVGLMGAGTGSLLAPRLGAAFAAFVLVLGQAMAIFAAFAPADGARLAAASAQGEVPTLVLRGVGPMHALVDVPASLLLIVGALWSWRRGRSPATLLIALGAMVFAGVHSLASGAQTGALSVPSAVLFGAGSLAGVVLLFAGYVASRPDAARAQGVPAGA